MREATREKWAHRAECVRYWKELAAAWEENATRLLFRCADAERELNKAEILIDDLRQEMREMANFRRRA